MTTFHAGQTFVFGEQPSSTKWGYLWDNDEYFYAMLQLLSGGFKTLDTSGNEILIGAKVASAVNELTITNAATGTPVRSAPTGGDSNIDHYLSGKGTGSARFAGPNDAWIAADEALTYVSATTFTCSAALAAALQVGDRLKLTQTTVKYFYIVGISGTTITVTGGSDYSLANAAITVPFYSHAESPTGFPDWFNYTPTFVGFSASPTSVFSQFKISGRACTVAHGEGADGTSNSTSFTISLPVTAATVSNALWQAIASISNSGAFAPGLVSISSGGTVMGLGKDVSNNAFTNSGAKRLFGVVITYGI